MPNPVIVSVVAAVALALVVRAALGVRSAPPPSPVRSDRAWAGLVPHTVTGWSSVGLALVYVLLLAAMEAIPGIDPFDSDPDLRDLGWRLVFAVTAGAAIAAGWSALRSRGDRSVLVYVAVALVVWVGLIPVLGSFFVE